MKPVRDTDPNIREKMRELAMQAAEPLTPDEDAIFGEIMNTGNTIMSVPRFKELARSCNMPIHRAKEAIVCLHDKGLLYIPLPDEKNVKLRYTVCPICGLHLSSYMGDSVAYCVCGNCLKTGTVTKIPFESWLEDGQG